MLSWNDARSGRSTAVSLGPHESIASSIGSRYGRFLPPRPGSLMPPLGPASVLNPLREQHPLLVQRFGVYRDRTAEWCAWWRSRYADTPQVCDGAFECRLNELQACTNVFDLLTRREWSREELAELDRLMARAMRLDEFRDWIAEGEQQIRLAIRRAGEWLGLGPERAADEECVPGETVLLTATVPAFLSPGEDLSDQPGQTAGKTYRGWRSDAGAEVEVVEPGKEPRPLDPRLDLKNHSPTGFEWGYAGSGPAQLANALAADVLGDDERARDVYQDLKFKLVARLDGDAWSLTEAEVRNQIAELEAKRGRVRD